MIGTLIESDISTTKDNKTNYILSIQAKFQYYGKVKTKIIDVKVTEDEYKKLSGQLGKQIDLDVIIPLPDFPLVTKNLTLQ